MTKSAFSQALSKLNPEALVELNKNVNQTFYTQAPYLVWKNMRLLTVDDSRLVRIELDNGEFEILCTSLTDMEMVPYEDMAELYHHRWNIEEGFKLFKARIEVENFTGKTARAVKQDFFAKVFMMSLCANLAFPIEVKVKKESKESANKHPKKINRTIAFDMLHKISIGLVLKNIRDCKTESKSCKKKET